MFKDKVLGQLLRKKRPQRCPSDNLVIFLLFFKTFSECSGLSKIKLMSSGTMTCMITSENAFIKNIWQKLKTPLQIIWDISSQAETVDLKENMLYLYLYYDQEHQLLCMVINLRGLTFLVLHFTSLRINILLSVVTGFIWQFIPHTDTFYYISWSFSISPNIM